MIDKDSIFKIDQDVTQQGSRLMADYRQSIKVTTRSVLISLQALIPITLAATVLLLGFENISGFLYLMVAVNLPVTLFMAFSEQKLRRLRQTACPHSVLMSALYVLQNAHKIQALEEIMSTIEQDDEISYQKLSAILLHEKISL